MEEDLAARLKADPALAALVGSRVKWLDRPTGMPAVTLQVINEGRTYHFKGATGLRGTRVQADCWGATYGQAKATARALIAAMEPSAAQGATRFGASFLDTASDFPPEDLAGGARAYRVMTDWTVWHRPA